MLVTPNNVKKLSGSFIFGDKVTAKAHPSLSKDIFAELWNGYCFRSSHLAVETAESLSFSVGSSTPADHNGFDFALRVTTDGISITSDTREGLARGFLTLIERIEPVELAEGRVSLKVDCCDICDAPDVAVRMVHLCIFPETDLFFLKRMLRFCGMLKYSHVILEFWGTLKYDCLKELAWECGYTKDELRPILSEARALGMELIPMFNHWGHATACRLCSGKHVVLDQNPALQVYFSPNGWSWNIEREDVRELLRGVRREMCELCGEGSYFHLGCDEVYECEQDVHMTKVFLEYLRELTDELLAEGRRPIIWGDMFLYNHGGDNENRYHYHCKNEEIEKLLFEGADRRVLIADWEYNATKKPIDTALLFKKQGFEVICCPWDNTDANVNVNVETVKENGLYGVMHTTWHTLAIEKNSGTRRLIVCAEKCWQTEGEKPVPINYATRAAEAWRKVGFTDGDYANSGWLKKQI